jgi:hypothetical protein
VNRRKPWVVLLLCVAVYGVWQQRGPLLSSGSSARKAVLQTAAWSRLDTGTAISPDAEVRALAAGPQGLVAVGTVGDDAGIWASLDGTAFAAVDAAASGPGTAGLAGSVRQRLDGVAVLGSGADARFVAVGADSTPTGTAGELDAAAWTSANGRDWTRAPHSREQLGGPGDQVMAAVTAGGPGLVAVGRSGAGAAVWTSADGLVWTRVASASLTAPEGGEQRLRAVAAVPGGLVAVGSVTGADLIERPAVWASTDGTAWARAPLPDALAAADADEGGPAGSLRALLVTSNQVLALGDVDGDAAVWTSPNGVTWTAVPSSVTGEVDGHAVLGGAGQQSIAGVAAATTKDGLRIVAVGTDGDRAAAWWSNDGYRWHAQPLLDDGDAPAAVIALADRFLAAGRAGAFWYLRV